MNEEAERVSDAVTSEEARRGLEKAEAGDSKATQQLDKAGKADPPGETAAEQEASDGPEGRGLSR